MSRFVIQDLEKFPGLQPVSIILLYPRSHKLTLAPKSTKACLNFEFPTTMQIVGLPGSLHFGGKLFLIKEVDCSVINTPLLTPNFLFTVHKSFKNLANDEIFFMASNKGMFTLTCLNNS